MKRVRLFHAIRLMVVVGVSGVLSTGCACHKNRIDSCLLYTSDAADE